MIDISLLPHLSDVVDSSIIDDLYIDLDGVVADYIKAANRCGAVPEEFKYYPGAYLWLEFIPNALESIQLLRTIFPQRVWFLSKPPQGSPYAYGEKALWTLQHLGQEGLDNLIITMDKSKVGSGTSVIVDDRPHKANLEKFRGEVIHFDAPTEDPKFVKYSFQPQKRVGWQETLIIINELVASRTQDMP